MLAKILDRLIKVGRLTVIAADGSRRCFGESAPREAELDVVVRLKGWSTPWRLSLWPDLALGEAYADGSLIIERGTLWNLLDLLGQNLRRESVPPNTYVRTAKSILRRLQQSNPIGNARRNAAHHYDLSHELFRSFLDDDLQYSCAYFAGPGMTLDEAQRAKKRHIAAKLLLRPGQRVLDIGCGWGGLALTLARSEQVEVVGVTLSREQLKVAQQRAHEENLDHRVKFHLQDYRQVDGKFDRIVSVGMFEHVGTPHIQEFFAVLGRLLTNDGVALIHSIGRMRGPDVTSAWIRKYIFPGGYIPAISQVMPAIERAGLWITDLEVLRLHYAETLRHWRERFLANYERLNSKYDERFRRMWEFYLAVSEMSFRFGGMMVFQAQLAREIDSVPIVRDYMFEREHRPWRSARG